MSLLTRYSAADSSSESKERLLGLSTLDSASSLSLLLVYMVATVGCGYRGTSSFKEEERCEVVVQRAAEVRRGGKEILLW